MRPSQKLTIPRSQDRTRWNDLRTVERSDPISEIGRGSDPYSAMQFQTGSYLIYAIYNLEGT